jgi:hypothetical protein
MSNEIDRLLEIADENGDGELECATAPPYNDCEFLCELASVRW